jgi:hypothetical protein
MKVYVPLVAQTKWVHKDLLMFYTSFTNFLICAIRELHEIKFQQSLKNNITCFLLQTSILLSIYVCLPLIRGSRGSVVGWDNVLQAGRSRFRSPMSTLDFSIDLMLSDALWAVGSSQPLTEKSTRNLPGGKGRRARKADITAICRLSVKCGSFDVSQPCGPPRLLPISVWPIQSFGTQMSVICSLVYRIPTGILWTQTNTLNANGMRLWSRVWWRDCDADLIPPPPKKRMNSDTAINYIRNVRLCMNFQIRWFICT